MLRGVGGPAAVMSVGWMVFITTSATPTSRQAWAVSGCVDLLLIGGVGDLLRVTGEPAPAGDQVAAIAGGFPDWGTAASLCELFPLVIRINGLGPAELDEKGTDCGCAEEQIAGLFVRVGFIGIYRETSVDFATI